MVWKTMCFSDLQNTLQDKNSQFRYLNITHNSLFTVDRFVFFTQLPVSNFYQFLILSVKYIQYVAWGAEVP